MHVKEFSPTDILGPLNEVEQKNAPDILFLLGDEELLRRGVRVSIVGSRKASKEGLRRAARFSKLLVSRGIYVVSGLAEGIDTAAHVAAVEEGGRTIAVIGTPLDQAYPAKNQILQDEIAKSHLVVSQFPIGSSVQKRNFPARNRTMALLTDATVIVEAKEDSGSLQQAWEAFRLGRPLFIMESILADKTLTWPAKVMQYGAQLLSDETVEGFFDYLRSGNSGDEQTFPF
ncbi:MAG: DNA-processing protein DprA [Deltaproteobacteria bacterium]|nr:DNA-processing protein DprA [Deltaproteobacteria bacterium]